MITYQELLKSGENELVSSNISDAELDAWYLLEYITGMSRAKFFLDRDMEVSDEIKDRYLSLIHMRKEHIPLQHITGKCPGSKTGYGVPCRKCPSLCTWKEDT